MPFLPKKSDSQKSPAKTMPPTPEEIARKLTPFCRKHGICRLEIFGSVARGDAHPGSDVDLVATFEKIPGLEYFGLIDSMEKILGTHVDLLLREDVDTMTNPYRKREILAGLRELVAL